MRKIKFKIYSIAVMAAAIIGCKKNQQLAAPNNSEMSGNTNFVALTGTVYYVSPTGNDSYTGTSRTFISGTNGPFKTIQRAANATSAGATVRILSGDYKLGTTGNSTVYVSISGAVGSPITYMADDPLNKPKIYAMFTDNSYRAFGVEANHIVLDGLEVVGDKTAAPGGATDPNIGQPHYNTNGIQIGAINNSTTLAVYDVVVKNCKVHDFPGGGIGCKHASQITINNNEVYNNSYYSEYKTSGISIVVPSNAGTTSIGQDGDSTHPKNIISNNICYNNQYLYGNSDGSGIIIDVNKVDGTYAPSPPLIDGDFRGYTRLENNVCMNNGGAGITTTVAQNVEIANNTCINNRIVFNTWGEVFINGNSSNVLISNNILSATSRSNGKAYALVINNADEKTTNNLLYPNVTENQTIAHAVNLSGSATPSANLLTSNVGFLQTLGTGIGSYTSGNYNVFKVSATSPAVDAGSNAGYIYYSYYDIFNTQRATGHAGTKADIGAYEYTF